MAAPNGSCGAPEQRPISPVDLFTGVLDVDNPSVDPGGIPDRADYLGVTFNPFVEGRTLKSKTMAVEAYCVKCKAKRDMKNAAEVTMANGRKAMKGTCPTCGTGMFKIMGKA